MGTNENIENRRFKKSIEDSQFILDKQKSILEISIQALADAKTGLEMASSPDIAARFEKCIAELEDIIRKRTKEVEEYSECIRVSRECLKNLEAQQVLH